METLAKDDELAKQMGKAARERYKQLFTGKLMGQRYAELYERLLSQ
jgi:glycosyltransferase involved in cell wall biosynthesis